MKIDLDDIERRAQTADANWFLEDITAPLPRETLALIAIVRAAKAVRVARRDGLRGDYEQDVHDALAKALAAAGLEEADAAVNVIDLTELGSEAPR